MGSYGASTDIDELVSKLALEEKLSLLAASDWWRTTVIERSDIFIPSIKVMKQG
jgi:beta-glucosidase